MNTECPSESVLQQLAQGDLDDRQTRELEEHLSCCPHCVTTLEEIWAGDTFARAIQEGARAEPQATSEPLSQLVERLKRLHPGAEIGVSDTDTTGLHTAAPADHTPPRAGGDDRRPARLGGYAIQAVLGTGGMGIVYRANNSSGLRH